MNARYPAKPTSVFVWRFGTTYARKSSSGETPPVQIGAGLGPGEASDRRPTVRRAERDDTISIWVRVLNEIENYTSAEKKFIFFFFFHRKSNNFQR